MGSWSASITGNDTAQDLLAEYSVAFFKYPVDEALEKLDAYVRKNICDESDPEEWVNYYYSLADFLWKKGILPARIRDTAIQMIDSRFAMELWEEAGKSELRQREKVLAKFREKLLSPQPPKKQIKPKVHMNPIFRPGDLIAIRLHTSGKPYVFLHSGKGSGLIHTQEEFRALDGKYLVIQLVKCHASWSSAFAPEIKDWWAYFRLIEGIWDEPPLGIAPDSLRPVLFDNGGDGLFSGYEQYYGEFYCESSMFWFKKRDYVLLGNAPISSHSFELCRAFPLIWGMDKAWGNPDSELVSALGQKTKAFLYQGELEPLDKLCRAGVGQYLNDAGIRGVDHRDEILKEKNRASEALQKAADTGRVYVLTHSGHLLAVLGIVERQINLLSVHHQAWGLGFELQLLRFVLSQELEGLCIGVSAENLALMDSLKQAGFQAESEEAGIVLLRTNV